MVNQDFINQHKRTTKSTSPILFFHTFLNDERDIEYQGYIFRLDKNGCGKAMLFEWCFGQADVEMGFTKSFLNRCHFYDNSHSMIKAAEVYAS